MRSAEIDRNDHSSQPLREFRARKPTIGELNDHVDDIGLGRIDFKIIQYEEHVYRDKRDALVAIDEWMIPSKAKAILGGKRREIGIGIVGENVLGPRERRFEHSLIAKSRTAAVLADLLCVQNLHKDAAQP